MKVKLLVGLIVALAAAAVVFMLIRPSRAPDVAGGEGGSSVAPAGSSGAGQRVLPSSNEPGAGSAGAAGGGPGTSPPEEAVDERQRPDAAPDPKRPPHADRLSADALVRQRDLVKIQLTAIKERIPKLRAVLARVRTGGQATAEQLQQIQNQIDQAVVAVARMEQELTGLEAKVARLKASVPKKGQPSP